MKNKFRSNLIKNLLLFCITLIIFCILLEIALRIAWHNPYAHAKADHILWIRRHNPGLNLQLNRRAIDKENPRIKFEVDERSFIKPSKRFSDPDYNIVFIGGSTTECLAVTDSLRFHNIVSLELEKKGIKVNALNIGHEGNTMQDALNILLNHILIDPPDYIVLMHNCNDVGLLRFFPNYFTRMGWTVNLRSIQRWMAQILSGKIYSLGFVKQKIDYTLRIMAYDKAIDDKHHEKWLEFDERLVEIQSRIYKYRSRLESFIDICRNFDISPILMTQPLASFESETSPLWLEESLQIQFNGIIREVCAEKGAILIDLEKYIYNIELDIGKPNAFFYDEVHINDKGSVVYGKYIAERINEELENAKSQDAQKSTITLENDTSEIPNEP